ncbi:hypothetical protein CEXT_143011 [Caerostris extrusa]|uniref:C2H2-type domain-containing protein n=1 Tax=Caerostris extrusa TaxID=172846 RepID=A0AAV4VCM5_CAEEX|nr:hypothetical protein CEXT_143011 [Caerostris extrusa]
MSTSTTVPTTQFRKCNVCRKAFLLLDSLIKHCHQHHPSLPHVCDLCGRAMKDLGNFKRHQLIHSGERPHVCQDCGKAFGRKDHLNQHQKSHKEKPYCCEYEWHSNKRHIQMRMLTKNRTVVFNRAFKCEKDFERHKPTTEQRKLGYCLLRSQPKTVDSTDNQIHAQSSLDNDTDC